MIPCEMRPIKTSKPIYVNKESLHTYAYLVYCASELWKKLCVAEN
jgi:hypothetical protein